MEQMRDYIKQSIVVKMFVFGHEYVELPPPNYLWIKSWVIDVYKLVIVEDFSQVLTICMTKADISLTDKSHE